MEERLSKKIRFGFSNHPAGYAGESLWSDVVGPDLYEIRNIPVFAYGVSFLDVVKAQEDEEGIIQVSEVIKKSAHNTIRVFFVDGKSAEENHERLIEFKGEGIGSEKWNDDLYALNVTPKRDYEAFIDKLEELEDQGIIEFELSGEWEGNFDGTEKC